MNQSSTEHTLYESHLAVCKRCSWWVDNVLTEDDLWDWLLSNAEEA